MTLSDQQVLDIINALLDYVGVPPAERVPKLRARRDITALRALQPIVDRYLMIIGEC